MNKTISALLILLILALTPGAEAAGMVVFDPANLAQQVQGYIQQYTQLLNQIQQYENQLVMLANQAKNLATMPSQLSGSVLGAIQRTISLVNQVQSDARGIANNYSQISTQFDHLYPSYGGYNGLSATDYANNVQQLFTQTHNAMYDSMRAQGLADPAQMQSDENMLNQLAQESTNAQGALEAAQAGNQIAAMIAQQIIEQKAIMAAAYRAQASFYEQQIQQKQLDQARQQQLMNNWGDPGAPSTPGSIYDMAK